MTEEQVKATASDRPRPPPNQFQSANPLHWSRGKWRSCRVNGGVLTLWSRPAFRVNATLQRRFQRLYHHFFVILYQVVIIVITWLSWSLPKFPHFKSSIKTISSNVGNFWCRLWLDRALRRSFPVTLTAMLWRWMSTQPKMSGSPMGAHPMTHFSSFATLQPNPNYCPPDSKTLNRFHFTKSRGPTVGRKWTEAGESAAHFPV